MKDSSKPSMIITKAIILIESNFIRYPEQVDEVATHVDIDYESSIDNKTGQGILTINVIGKNVSDDNAIFESRIRYLGVFCQDEANPNMSIEEFMKVNAPAQIYPFAREFLASLSNRSDIPSVILPPVNIAAVVSLKMDAQIKNNKINVPLDGINQ